ncbi:MAG: thioredoxin domain-containing protein, partial [Planctomycetes bacterium]|nr:thioredoxin domain-containing protein [Planctomycetota bacterium]
AMRDDDGRLLRTRRSGRSHIPAFLEDYAALARGLLDLYEVDPQLEWIEAARGLHAQIEARFSAGDDGSYFATADDAEALIVRRKSAQESSLPSPVGLAAEVAARIGLLAGETDIVDRARAVLRQHGQELARYPNAFGQLLRLIDFLEARPAEIYVASTGTQDELAESLVREVQRVWPPYRVLALLAPDKHARLDVLLPAASGKSAVDGKPTAFVCTEGTCRAPVTSLVELRAELRRFHSR